MATQTTRHNDQQNQQAQQNQQSTQQTTQKGGTDVARQGDRERSIEASREGHRGAGAGLARRGQFDPVFGGALGEPFALMRRMAEDMDRLFDQFGFGRTGLGAGLFRDIPRAGSLLRDAERGAWTPQVEMFQRGDRLVVRADVPGMKKEDLQIDVEDGLLTLRGERRDEREENEEGLYRSERSYGQFFRAIPLPEGVDAEQCEAAYKDGVLEVTLPAPKQEARRARRIQIR
ncbi:MAG: Hsp20/alpha crystallin family protein [Gemmatimonadaceae bacterium]